MKHKLLLILAIVAAVAVVALIIWAATVPSPSTPETTGASTNPMSSSIPNSTSTTTAPITAPATTIPPASVPTINANQKIGTLYTKAELDAMDNTRNSFWPNGDDGKRPSVVTVAQRVYRDHGVHFIGSDSTHAYLTFNCDEDKFTLDSAGQPISNTAVVLDMLRNSQVKATFFVTGNFCRKYPQVVQRIIDEGHILGNYGYSSIELPELSTEEMVAQIMTLHNYVQENFGYTMKYFRPYNGAYSLRTFALANSLGYTTMLYSASYTDKDLSSQVSSSVALEKLTSQFHNGVIFRLHTISPTTVSILGDLIGILRDSNYRVSLFQS